MKEGGDEGAGGGEEGGEGGVRFVKGCERGGGLVCGLGAHQSSCLLQGVSLTQLVGEEGGVLRVS